MKAESNEVNILSFIKRNLPMHEIQTMYGMADTNLTDYSSTKYMFKSSCRNSFMRQTSLG